jgi:hypothetical protein
VDDRGYLLVLVRRLHPAAVFLPQGTENVVRSRRDVEHLFWALLGSEDAQFDLVLLHVMVLDEGDNKRICRIGKLILPPACVVEVGHRD